MEAEVCYESIIKEMRSYKNNIVCLGLWIDTPESPG